MAWISSRSRARSRIDSGWQASGRSAGGRAHPAPGCFPERAASDRAARSWPALAQGASRISHRPRSQIVARIGQLNDCCRAGSPQRCCLLWPPRRPLEPLASGRRGQVPVCPRARSRNIARNASTRRRPLRPPLSAGRLMSLPAPAGPELGKHLGLADPFPWQPAGAHRRRLRSILRSKSSDRRVHRRRSCAHRRRDPKRGRRAPVAYCRASSADTDTG